MKECDIFRGIKTTPPGSMPRGVGRQFRTWTFLMCVSTTCGSP